MVWLSVTRPFGEAAQLDTNISDLPLHYIPRELLEGTPRRLRCTQVTENE